VNTVLPVVNQLRAILGDCDGDPIAVGDASYKPEGAGSVLGDQQAGIGSPRAPPPVAGRAAAA